MYTPRVLHFSAFILAASTSISLTLVVARLFTVCACINMCGTVYIHAHVPVYIYIVDVYCTCECIPVKCNHLY